jgi:putative ABC transport system permease protein
MLKSYLLTTLRQLRSQPGTTFIHIAGLTLGITTCLILFLIIQQEYSFDRYHKQFKQIYRVETLKITPGDTSSYSGAPLGLADALRDEFPQIKQVTTIRYSEESLIGINVPGVAAKRFKEPVAYAEILYFLFLTTSGWRVVLPWR